MAPEAFLCPPPPNCSAICATSRSVRLRKLTFACRALDRVLRAGRYWIPMWYRSDSWVAYWDVFARPDTAPKYGTGAPGTWWWDEEKAKRIGRG